MDMKNADMKILFVVIAGLLASTTTQATEIKEQVGPYEITLCTVLNTTAQNDTISDEQYGLNINYTIPEGWALGQIYIERSNDTLANLAKDYKSNITKIGYIPLTERYEKIDGREGVIVPYKSNTSLLPSDFYQFGYWLDNKTLVGGWISFEPEGPCWETKQDQYISIADCLKLLQNPPLPRSLRTLHVTTIY
jgi:hypothetical protein